LCTLRRHEFRFFRNPEKRGQLPFQTCPETNRLLDGDDHRVDLQTRTLFAARLLMRVTLFRTWTAGRTLAIVTRFTTRTALRSRTCVRCTRRSGMANWSAGLATRFAGGGRFFSEVARDGLLDFGGIFHDAHGRTIHLTWSGRSDATRRSATSKLFGRCDRAWLGGGFGGGPNDGKRWKFCVGRFQFCFADTGGVTDFTSVNVRGWWGGGWLRPGVGFLTHVALFKADPRGVAGCSTLRDGLLRVRTDALFYGV